MLPIERLDGLGVRPGPHGPRLRVWSANAQRMRLCLLAADGGVETELEMHRTPEAPELWELVTPLLAPGARYALRADGPQGPGHAFDPAALLLDPYAKGLERIGAPGEERWCGVVGPDRPATPGPSPRRPLAETVVYELHVRGFTRRAGFLPPELRGSYAGLGHPDTVEHLLRLGVTAVELLPVHAFASERFLRERGMANFWGYNTLGFFAPHPDYASPAARAAGAAGVAEEFRQAVGRLHEAGIEVLLDVVYNHTAEGGADGAVLSFRGLDNAGYYRLDERGGHLDTSGTGNALDASRPVVQRLVLDSLAHWVREYGVDGFRFDLAASLGRDADGGFRSDHPLLTAIAADERLAGAKLIAEPWDVGPGGWRTGEFPAGWSEWNDTFRDRVRSFWVEDVGRARRTGVHPAGVGPFTTAVAGSSDRFSDDRGPLASVNYVTAHDGFTLHDLVSYNVKHNLLNGELDRDGSSDNRSYNFGAEGPCDDERILSARRLAMRNLLGSLLLASGVPMLTAGDEYARTQHGNNNPYNQDNETSWFDWEPDERQRALAEHVARLLEIRRSHPALRPLAYNHNGDLLRGATSLRWFDALGGAMQGHAWDSPATRTVQYLARAGVPRPGGPRTPGGVRADAAAAGPGPVEDGAEVDAVLVVVHGSEFPTLLRLPVVEGIAGYALLWDSAAETVGRIWDDPAACEPPAGATLRMPGPSMRLYRAVPETPAVRAPD